MLDASELEEITEVDKLLERKSMEKPKLASGEQGEGWLEQADSEEQIEDEQISQSRLPALDCLNTG